MSNTARHEQRPGTRDGIGLFQTSSADAQVARWKINGFSARILVWTAKEWEQLTERPTDAQYYPCGVWCALRVD